jgi:hypothetical protein
MLDMTATFILGYLFAEIYNTQIFFLHLNGWPTETFSTTRKAIFRTVFGRLALIISTVHVSQ